MTTITIFIIGALLSFSILYLVRRGKLHGPYATWWLMVALVAILLASFPKIIDWIALQVGITYPPTLLLVVAVSFILIRMLSMDLALSRKEQKIRRLTQRLAMLEEGLENDKRRQSGPGQSD